MECKSCLPQGKFFTLLNAWKYDWIWTCKPPGAALVDLDTLKNKVGLSLIILGSLTKPWLHYYNFNGMKDYKLINKMNFKKLFSINFTSGDGWDVRFYWEPSHSQFSSLHWSSKTLLVEKWPEILATVCVRDPVVWRAASYCQLHSRSHVIITGFWYHVDVMGLIKLNAHELQKISESSCGRPHVFLSMLLSKL